LRESATWFQLIATQIDEQIKVLEEQDSSRRDMVANISHDLRTPLSPIHRYLGLLSNKYDELDENLKQEFYDTTFKHSARLPRLITALFELLQLNAPGFRIKTEAFQVADLLQDVVQEFKLTADKLLNTMKPN
jgi:two-component system sensor histidine kinase SaeS